MDQAERILSVYNVVWDLVFDFYSDGTHLSTSQFGGGQAVSG